jgi:hypothetical protein
MVVAGVVHLVVLTTLLASFDNDNDHRDRQRLLNVSTLKSEKKR